MGGAFWLSSGYGGGAGENGEESLCFRTNSEDVNCGCDEDRKDDDDDSEERNDRFFGDSRPSVFFATGLSFYENLYPRALPSVSQLALGCMDSSMVRH
jgi:hypothetical protein